MNKFIHLSTWIWVYLNSSQTFSIDPVIIYHSPPQHCSILSNNIQAWSKGNWSRIEMIPNIQRKLIKYWNYTKYPAIFNPGVKEIDQVLKLYQISSYIQPWSKGNWSSTEIIPVRYPALSKPGVKGIDQVLKWYQISNYIKPWSKGIWSSIEMIPDIKLY